MERPSGLNPQLFHLQKDYMSARLEAKEEQIRQLEQQHRALQQMLMNRTKVDNREQANMCLCTSLANRATNCFSCVSVCVLTCIFLFLSHPSFLSLSRAQMDSMWGHPWQPVILMIFIAMITMNVIRPHMQQVGGRQCHTQKAHRHTFIGFRFDFACRFLYNIVDLEFF